EWERDLRFTTNRDRVANRDVLVPLVEAAFRRRTTDDWLGRLQAEGVPCAPIRSVDRVLADPQVRQRGMVAEMAHPVHGKLPALTLEADGRHGTARLERATTDLGEAVEGAEILIAPLPATGHEDLAKRLAPCLTDRQIVLLTPGTLGSYAVARGIVRAGGT